MKEERKMTDEEFVKWTTYMKGRVKRFDNYLRDHWEEVLKGMMGPDGSVIPTDSAVEKAYAAFLIMDRLKDDDGGLNAAVHEMYQFAVALSMVDLMEALEQQRN